MRDLTEYVCKAMDMLDSIGIKYGNIIDCTVNTRAQKRWGQCRKVPAVIQSISMLFFLMSKTARTV